MYCQQYFLSRKCVGATPVSRSGARSCSSTVCVLAPPLVAASVLNSAGTALCSQAGWKAVASVPACHATVRSEPSTVGRARSCVVARPVSLSTPLYHTHNRCTLTPRGVPATCHEACRATVAAGQLLSSTGTAVAGQVLVAITGSCWNSLVC